MSASGLPGNRVEARRAGMITIGLVMSGNRAQRALKKWARRRAYTCCQVQRKAANQDSAWGLCALVAETIESRLIAGPSTAMETTNANKVALAVLGALLGTMVARRLHQRGVLRRARR